MKRNAIVVGILSALGLALGAGACPPGDDDQGFVVRLAPGGHFTALSPQGLKLGNHVFKLDADCCQGQGPHTFVFDCQGEDDDDNAPQVFTLDPLSGGLQNFTFDLAPFTFSPGADPLVFSGNIDGNPFPQGFTVSQPDAKAKKSRTTTTSRSSDNSRPDANSAFTLVQDDNTIALKIEDGKIVSCERNGKKVPLDHIKRDGDHVRILGDNDDTVFEFSMSDDGAVSVGGGKQLRLRALGGQPGSAITLGNMAAANMEPPKAMIGVQLGQPDGMLLGHFGLKPGDATLIIGVYEGLPASKAGLEPYDIIVSVDGKSPAGEGAVRDALRNRDDGDRITLTVIHRGERHDAKLKLVKYDQDSLEKSKLNSVEADTFAWRGGGDQGGNVFVAPYLDQFKNWQNQNPEQLREWAEKFAEQLKQQGGNAQNPFHFSPQQPAPPPAAGNGNEARWERLEERLQRLEKMIERLAEHRAEGQGGGNKPK